MSYRSFGVTVVANHPLSPTFRRLTLGSRALAALAWAGADQRVKLLVGDRGQLDELGDDDGWYARWSGLPETGRPPMRTYTIAASRPERCEVDIDFAVHGDAGPLSRFARRAVPGDHLVLVAPARGEGAADGLAWHPGTARRLLCVGDETALPAIRNILAGLGPGPDCRCVIEVPDAGDRVPLPSPVPVRVQWAVRRAGEPVGAAADRVLFGGPPGPASSEDPDLWQEATSSDSGRYAWVAGEVGWVNRVRKRLGPAGFGRANASFMGYWREGHPSRG